MAESWERQTGRREAFVLWVERGSASGVRELRGVVERSATSRRIAFRSGEQLLRILRSELAGRRSAPSQLPAPFVNTTDEEGEQ